MAALVGEHGLATICMSVERVENFLDANVVIYSASRLAEDSEKKIRAATLMETLDFGTSA